MNNRTVFQKLAFLSVPLALSLMPQFSFADPSGHSGLTDGFFTPACQQLAQARPQDRPRPDENARHEKMVEALGLSPEQSQKLKAIMQQNRAKGYALREQVHTKRKAMMDYLQSPDANEATARQMNTEINDLQRQLSDLRLQTWFAMRAELTPEQVRKFGELHKNRGHHGPNGQ